MQEHLKHHPLSYFMYDPPIRIYEPADWGMSPQGLGFIEQNGVWHVTDWIGENNYPNAADIWEEIASWQGSTLTPIVNALAQLTPGQSRRLLASPVGWIDNPEPYRSSFVDLQHISECVLPETEDLHKEHVEHGDLMCSALWWQIVTGEKVNGGRLIARKIGDTRYEAAAPIKEHPPEYQLAFIGWLPIDEIDLVVGDMAANPDDINKEIQAALWMLDKINPQLSVNLTNA
jgi:hypothetical protein